MGKEKGRKIRENEKINRRTKTMKKSAQSL
jgi:hypothetical protein